ncbi:MAG: energy-coupling factor transporter transmembrane protein EcfT [Propionibacteriaceae bacterium]|jgi:energy-coupling factor transport system permease protein|nr:energy-coupling factor transporter transmembrane protein EcfT [Propionibacteriaceae bacterium]
MIEAGANRPFHPAAWWGWALAVAVVATRTTNLLLLVLLAMVLSLTVMIKRSSAPWALGFHLYVAIAAWVILIRLFFAVVFNGGAGSTIWIDLPTWHLPGPWADVALFGPISAQGVVTGLANGGQLAVMILAVGAANTLANPKRLLAAVPAALYQWGTVMVIALSVFPQLVESVGRINRARRLRSDESRRWHVIKEVAMPVLADCLDRSLALAGSMDSRGYGRQAGASLTTKRLTTACLIVAILAACVGAYALLNTGALSARLGLPMLLGGLVLAVVGLKLAGTKVQRSRYRPDRFTIRAWALLAVGLIAIGLAVAMSQFDPLAAYPPANLASLPLLDWWACGAVLILLSVLLIAPAPRRPVPLAPENRPAAVGANGRCSSVNATEVTADPASTLPATLQPDLARITGSDWAGVDFRSLLRGA